MTSDTLDSRAFTPPDRERIFARGERLGSAMCLVILDGAFLETTPRGLLARVAGPGDYLEAPGYWATAGRAAPASSDRLDPMAGTADEVPPRRRALEERIDCVTFHSAASRLAGLLSAIHRRTGEDCVLQTQQDLARLTGVRRATISEIFQGLQSDRIVVIKRGQVRILDPQRLARAACGCDAA